MNRILSLLNNSARAKKPSALSLLNASAPVSSDPNINGQMESSAVALLRRIGQPQMTARKDAADLVAARNPKTGEQIFIRRSDSRALAARGRQIAETPLNGDVDLARRLLTKTDSYKQPHLTEQNRADLQDLGATNAEIAAIQAWRQQRHEAIAANKADKAQNGRPMHKLNEATPIGEAFAEWPMETGKTIWDYIANLGLPDAKTAAAFTAGTASALKSAANAISADNTLPQQLAAARFNKIYSELNKSNPSAVIAGNFAPNAALDALFPIVGTAFGVASGMGDAPTAMERNKAIGSALAGELFPKKAAKLTIRGGKALYALKKRDKSDIADRSPPDKMTETADSADIAAVPADAAAARPLFAAAPDMSAAAAQAIKGTAPQNIAVQMPQEVSPPPVAGASAVVPPVAGANLAAPPMQNAAAKAAAQRQNAAQIAGNAAEETKSARNIAAVRADLDAANDLAAQQLTKSQAQGIAAATPEFRQAINAVSARRQELKAVQQAMAEAQKAEEAAAQKTRTPATLPQEAPAPPVAGASAAAPQIGAMLPQNMQAASAESAPLSAVRALEAAAPVNPISAPKTPKAIKLPAAFGKGGEASAFAAESAPTAQSLMQAYLANIGAHKLPANSSGIDNLGGAPGRFAAAAKTAGAINGAASVPALLGNILRSGTMLGGVPTAPPNKQRR